MIRPFRAVWCVCPWRAAPWCLLDNLLACRVRWVCDRHDAAITGYSPWCGFRRGFLAFYGIKVGHTKRCPLREDR